MMLKVITCAIAVACGLLPCLAPAKVQLGVDRFFDEEFSSLIKGKKVGLITNQTGVNSALKPTVEIFKEKARGYSLVALFCPEHGLNGQAYAWEKIKNSNLDGIPIYSLHGETRRPTEQMLKGIDVLVYDIQDIGTRPYTYATTLYYVMEEAAKKKISVIVLDRPNPLGGIVDGPMLEQEWRSFIGYINVPYCHGMTIGELATFFNHEYKVNCDLKVVRLKGWKRKMLYKETGLAWIPASPNMPEADTPFYSASTGLLGELGILNIGIGFTMPFKVVGAPWIDAQKLAKALNAQRLPGVQFSPFHYRPFYGSFKGKDCQGVLILIDDPLVYQPLTVQYLIIGLIKSLYPKNFREAIEKLPTSKRNLFCKANGNSKMFEMLKSEKYIGWALVEYQKEERKNFLLLREKYLFPEYN